MKISIRYWNGSKYIEAHGLIFDAIENEQSLLVLSSLKVDEIRAGDNEEGLVILLEKRKDY